MQLINRTKCFRIIAPKAVGTLDDHMRELTRTGILQQTLIALAIR
ncbi:MAG: hypothetical protein SF123_15030 [Chloroflexota bacterium]|nr:hypothetical protein [Chloroflexota bacterium]